MASMTISVKMDATEVLQLLKQCKPNNVFGGIKVSDLMSFESDFVDGELMFTARPSPLLLELAQKD